MQQSELIPERYREVAEHIAETVRKMDRVLIAAHASPDGDAFGAVAAAGYMLRALGKEAFIYVTPRVPLNLSFIPLPGPVVTKLAHLPFEPRCALFLDCSESHRLGPELDNLMSALESVNIDHHLGSEGMGSMANWVEPKGAATTQLVAYIALALGLALKGDLATAVALGLVTDTGGFRYSNTSPEVLHLAAHLVANGCDLAALRAQLDNSWSLSRMRLWGELMCRAEMRRSNTVAFCPIFLADLRSTGAHKEDLEGFVEQLRQLHGVKVAAVLREDAPGCCKFSLRSSGTVDVCAAAALLGGGGHRNASGGTVRMTMEDAEANLLSAIGQELANEGL